MRFKGWIGVTCRASAAVASSMDDRIISKKWYIERPFWQIIRYMGHSVNDRLRNMPNPRRFCDDPKRYN